MSKTGVIRAHIENATAETLPPLAAAVRDFHEGAEELSELRTVVGAAREKFDRAAAGIMLGVERLSVESFILRRTFTQKGYEEFGEAALPHLVACFEREDLVTTTLEILESFGEHALPAYGNILEVALSNDSDKVRNYAKDLLDVLDGNRTYRILLAEIESAHTSQRGSYALEHLTSQVDRLPNEAVQRIVSLLEGPRSLIVDRVCRFISKCLTSEENKNQMHGTIEPLIRLLERDDCRYCSITTLGDLGKVASKSVPTIAAYIDDPRFTGIAAKALGQIKANPEVSIPALVRNLSTDKFRDFVEVVSAIGAFKGTARRYLTEPSEQPTEWTARARHLSLISREEEFTKVVLVVQVNAAVESVCKRWWHIF